MSLMLYLAADIPLDTVKNPYIHTFSVNEALKMGWTDIPPWYLAPDFDRDSPVLFQRNPPIVYNVDDGTIDDGNFDDDFEIYAMDPGDDPSGASRPFRVAIECNLTPSRAGRILDYIRTQLEKAGEIELWSLWLSDDEQKSVFYEAQIDTFTPEDLMQIEKLPCKDEPPKAHCVRIRK